MVRLEIVGNISLEQDLLDALEDIGFNFYYTKLSQVKGKGDQGQKQMDSIWPEENFLIFTYIEESYAEKVIEIVYDIKCAFPKEGINVFQVRSLEIQEPDRVKKAQKYADRILAQKALELEAELQGKKVSSCKSKSHKNESEELKEIVTNEGSLF